MLVSIIVPVYNSSKYLSECIESILNQTYKNIEVILIDDGSTDGSFNICNKYANGKNIKLFKQKNSGAGAARMLGVNKSSGDIVMFLDSDDLIARNAVSIIVEEYKKNKVDIIRFHGCYYPDGKILERIKIKNKCQILNRSELIDKMILSDKLSSMCFQAYKKECFSGVKFANNITYCEDYITNQRIHSRNWILGVIDNTLYYYRINTSSTTKTDDIKKLQRNVKERIFACNETLKFINKNMPEANQMIAKGYQIDRVRLDLLKLCIKYDKKERMNEIKRLFKSEDLNLLIRNIDYNCVNKYINSIKISRRIKVSVAIKAIYNCDEEKFLKSVKIYSIFTKIRALIRG